MALLATNISMLGDSGVGKSSIVLQLCDQTFSYEIISTVGESIALNISIAFPLEDIE